jgi:hypothetical protein
VDWIFTHENPGVAQGFNEDQPLMVANWSDPYFYPSTTLQVTLNISFILRHRKQRMPPFVVINLEHRHCSIMRYAAQCICVTSRHQ